MTDYNSLSEEEQIKAVQENGYMIQFIDNPSEAVKLAAVQNNGYAVQYVGIPSEAVKLAAVQQNGWAIQYIKNPNEAVQLAAVKENRFINLYKIRNPSKEVIKYCLYEYDETNEYYLRYLYSKLTSDDDKMYFKIKYGSIVND